NWSRSANEKNDENTLIIHDVYIANQYMQEFKSSYNQLGGNNSFSIPTVTSIKNNNKNLTANSFILNQNYPNPFNPTTIINYTIPVVDADFASTRNVSLKVYNVLGKEVQTLVNQKQQPGEYSVTFNAENLSTGIYFYKLQVGGFLQSKKMLLIK
ncbi:MAG: T9SS type A sorting domain-containing protein, partial [Ignavibacteriae bacterium]|nr:T9SS type A sorting domain-containing protein [Ignavibacteriota bacterium]